MKILKTKWDVLCMERHHSTGCSTWIWWNMSIWHMQPCRLMILTYVWSHGRSSYLFILLSTRLTMPDTAVIITLWKTWKLCTQVWKICLRNLDYLFKHKIVIKSALPCNNGENKSLMVMQKNLEVSTSFLEGFPQYWNGA